MQIPDIKKNLSITKVLAHYSIKIDKNQHIKCPFHEDEKPSCKIYIDTNTYNCFGCGKTGDVIQFIQDKESCNKHEALKKASELIGETKNIDVMGIASKQAVKVETENFAELFEKQKEGLPRSPKAQAYLQERGLSPLGETGNGFEIPVLSGVEVPVLSGVEVGYNSGVNWKKLKQCLTFPLKDQSGNIVSLYGRRISDGKGHSLEYGRHYYSENRKGLYPGYPNEKSEKLIITE